MTSRAIVGRERELELVLEALESRGPAPVALFIEGQPGIGKTALLDAAFEQMRDDATVLSCRPAEAEAAYSFAALGDLLAGVVDAGVLHELPGPQRAALSAALLLADEGGRPDHRTIGAATLSILRMLSSSGRVIVAIDDAQWLDRPSARVLASVLRRVVDEPITFVATRRPEPTVPVLMLDAALRERDVVRITLGPLSVGALARAVDDQLGLRFPRSILLRIHSVSDGNPFFARELARTLAERDVVPGPGQPLPVPEDLQALLEARIRRLPKRARHVLTMASLLAKPTDEILASIVGEPWRATVDLLLTSGIAELVDGVLSFDHPLLASAVVASSTAADLRTAHRELASVVGDHEQRARHLALATDRPDGTVAAALETASLLAMNRGAPDAAAELAELAVSFTPSARVVDVVRRTLLGGQARFAVGDLELAEAHFSDAVLRAEPGDGRATANWWLGRARYSRSDFAGSIDALERALDEATDDRLRAVIEEDMAYDTYTALDLEATRRHAAAAIELAERAGATHVLAEALAGLATTDFIMGRGLRRDDLERALAHEDWTELRPIVLRPSILVALVLSWIDDHERSRALLDRADRELTERGDDASLPFVRYRLAQIDCWEGDWEDGLARAIDAHRLAEQIQPENIATNCYAVALLAAHLGDVDRARAFADAGIAAATAGGGTLGLGMNLEVLGFVEASCGNADRAVALWSPVVERTRAGGIDEPAWLWYLPEFIEALIVEGDLAEAESLIDWVDARARAIDRPRGLAGAARGRALLAAAQGRTDEALAACDDALAQHERVVVPFEHARTYLVRGQVARRARRWGIARESLDTACERFRELGARLWLERAESERARIGGRTSSRWELSESERKVAELVSQGRSNREVAEVLFLSPKTVSATLGRVYRKLNVTSRTELAAKLAGRH